MRLALQVNPGASLLMVISVGLVILYLFGELYALKIRFNQVSIINMVGGMRGAGRVAVSGIHLLLL
jgi:hypothetical protein